MHFVHSLWTRPMITKRRNAEFVNNILVTTYCNATSVAWLKHLGANVDLYADGLGSDMLEYLPYDNIYPLKVPTNMLTNIWACGKFLALEKMPLGDVHIDGDVFIKSDKLIDLITTPNYDMVVQSIEDDETTLKKYYTSTRNILLNNNIQTKSCSILEAPSFNCGTIGFYNQELKNKYLTEYFFAVKNILKNRHCIDDITSNPDIIPDLVLEQQFLYELAKDYKVNNLLNSQGSVIRLFDKVILHNTIFPETSYTFYKFTGFKGSTIMPIFRQNFIKNSSPATQIEITTYMAALGFDSTEKKGCYTNSKYKVWDVLPRNVLKDKDGDIFVIDAEIKLI